MTDARQVEPVNSKGCAEISRATSFEQSDSSDDLSSRQAPTLSNIPYFVAADQMVEFQQLDSQSSSLATTNASTLYSLQRLAIHDSVLQGHKG